MKANPTALELQPRERRNVGMLVLAAQHSISSASRFARVSGRFALMIRQLAVRLYDGGHVSKNFHAARCALNSFSDFASSTAALRFS